MNIDDEINKKIEQERRKERPSFHEHIADIVAEFGGSWTFIFIFSAFFVGWILFNTYIYSFDPPPFIMLNLVLSCLAVFQAPFILISQNRLHTIDKRRAINDYKVNIKTELEVIDILKKLDELIDETRRNRIC